MRWKLLVLVCAVFSNACYNWVDVKPTELPKLNDMTVVSNAWTGEVTESRVVERSDGVLTPIKGKFDLRIQKTNGESLKFADPVRTSASENELSFQGGNRATTTVPLTEIRSTRVSQYSVAKSVLLTLAITIPLVALAGVAAVAAASD
jgi:hypothetical protein